ncbi:zf-HC2 domain-containing protein [Mangrovihabitans endophyticus]|uniref:Zinc-finger n=1 Tax=Mangrovihabitans endophyticus TaxID=1751298 RepID=A0A8J3C3E0_9ACTN|nr:zf-HC2 domain-containing protein [Mangrovihabitans endophyticus]GGL04243.1 hypothetical protein GCM10012284_43630 [Mangrovihabitans endophyticus]
MTPHPTGALLSRYARGADGVDEATVWALEAHLECCAACRAALAGAVDPATVALLDEVAVRIGAGVAAGPGPARPRRLRRTGVAARTVRWLAAAAVTVLAAVACEKSFASMPSLVLLVAPMAPLLPVAAVWSRHTDPAWELVATGARAGLWLLLRRTLAVLLAVTPVLAVAGWQTGHAPARWLLPCLAFTAGSLALGAAIGVDRAAVALALGWSAAVVLPSLAGQRLPGVLDSAAWPLWTGVLAVCVAVLLARGAGRRAGPGRP